MPSARLLSVLPVMGLLSLGCSGLGSTGTGYWYGDPEDPYQGQDYFQPDTVLAYAYAAYHGDRLEDFMLEQGNAASALPPVLMLYFADHRYFVTGNPDYVCEWVGEMAIEGLDDLGEGSELWLGYAIRLKMLETDCYDMDPWVWGEPTPTTMLETAFLGVGFGPISTRLASVLKPLVAESDDAWERDWAPYTFGMHLGFWDAEAGDLIGQEIGFVQSYEMVDGALLRAQDGSAVPVALDPAGGPPEGLYLGLAFAELDPEAFL